jgi:uncharacterized alkaline shock family protein YloU
MQEILSNGCSGQISISNEVLAIISGTAALEVDGVITGAYAHQGDMSAGRAKKNFAKGVKITLEEDKVKVDISIMVKYGYKIHQISEDVQKRIVTAIETMVGMQVSEVNVNVVGLKFEKSSRKGGLRSSAKGQ